MPSYTGMWTIQQQFQGRGQGVWPKGPGAPTIGTATPLDTSASVAFTAPTCTGYPSGAITAYTVTSTPGCFTGTGASSPFIVSGLTNCTSYTFKVRAQSSNGLYGPCSAASASVTPKPFSSYLIIAGGAGGGMNQTTQGGGGGGGAGGVIVGCDLLLNTGTTYTITVGGGGSGVNYAKGGSGTNSSAFGKTAIGGGGGAGGYCSCVGNTCGFNGVSGGSGGGAGAWWYVPFGQPGIQFSGTAGAGTAGQGFAGGSYLAPTNYTAGYGGGGAGGSPSGTNCARVPGANGIQSSITGTATYYGGGGGGGGSAGGLGGGGRGGVPFGQTPTSGTANTGGGGGSLNTFQGGTANGGSGVVILRTRSTAVATTGSPVVTTACGFNIYKFNSSGTIRF